MPMYVFEHPTTGVQKEVFQKMNDVHEYFEDGIKWNRVLLPTSGHVSLGIDPFSPQDFVKKTKDKKMNVGDMWDESAKLSKLREKKQGVDKVKLKTSYEYTKKTGLPHPQCNK